MALGLAVALVACSDDDGQRDQFYGTDVGANYQLPDGFLDRTPDTGGADAREAGELDAAPGEMGRRGAAQTRHRSRMPGKLPMPNPAGKSQP